jgi:hypothetical protein
MVFSITLLSVRTESLKYSEKLDSVRTSSGRLAETSQTMSTTEIQLCVEIGEAWPSVRTMLLWCPDIFNAEASRHCGVSGRLKMARLDGCTGTGFSVFSVLEFARNLHGHLLETCDQSHVLKWTLSIYMKTLKRTDHPPYAWRIWKEPIILLICNHYIKCFCHPKCSQHKILTKGSSTAYLGLSATPSLMSSSAIYTEF